LGIFLLTGVTALPNAGSGPVLVGLIGRGTIWSDGGGVPGWAASASRQAACTTRGGTSQLCVIIYNLAAASIQATASDPANIGAVID